MLDWVLSGVRRVDVSDLKDGIDEVARRYGLPIDVTVREDAEEAAELLGPDEWSYQIEADMLGRAAIVEVNQSQVDGSGPFDGWVTAHRTRLAVLLGIMTAVAWHSLGGGDLSGTGLGDRRLSNDEPVLLLDEILLPGSEVEEAANRAAERLGCAALPLS